MRATAGSFTSALKIVIFVDFTFIFTPKYCEFYITLLEKKLAFE